MSKIRKFEKTFIRGGKRIHPHELTIGDVVEELDGELLFTKVVVDRQINDDGSLSLVYAVNDMPFEESEYITKDDDTVEEIQEKKKWYQKLNPFSKKVI